MRVAIEEEVRRSVDTSGNMFSGLGNFPDLNSTFAQLSNFSLDALQSSETDPKVVDAAATGELKTSVQPQVSFAVVRTRQHSPLIVFYFVYYTGYC